jgi:hypothetical protein
MLAVNAKCVNKPVIFEGNVRKFFGRSTKKRETAIFRQAAAQNVMRGGLLIRDPARTRVMREHIINGSA